MGLRFVVAAALLGCTGDTFVVPDGGDGATCPDEHGNYGVTFAGQACPIATVQPDVCISQTACGITLSTANGSIAGTVSLNGDGSFTNATIQEGMGNTRMGCVGTWDSSNAQLAITCGGMSSSQTCVATLVRKGLLCPL